MFCQKSVRCEWAYYGKYSLLNMFPSLRRKEIITSSGGSYVACSLYEPLGYDILGGKQSDANEPRAKIFDAKENLSMWLGQWQS